MIALDIPGFGKLTLKHLVLDFNGTVAVDGLLIPGTAEKLRALSPDLTIHVITADTFGSVAAQTAALPITLTVLPPGDQAKAKADYVKSLGMDRVIAIGNGRNDRDMLKAAAIGVALIQAEGAAAQAIASADVVCLSILDALDLLLHPARLMATLRS